MQLKTITASLAILISSLFYATGSSAQGFEHIDTTGFYKKTVTTHGKYTLVFINKEPGFDTSEGTKLIDLFFKVYPKEAAEYNPNTPTTVTFVIDPTYTTTPAATSGATTRFSPDWFKQHPEDIDCATHELMHVVQAYNFSNYGTNEAVMPVWLVEGIADFARYEFGINNVASGWTMPDYNPSQSYTNSYRVTARFFAWLVKNKNKDVIKDVDNALRDGTYSYDVWKKITGETLDELWKDYGANPAIALQYH